MEKVSAMKKVALFLMIVGLAVALVACEGPVGTPGEKGEKGDKGDTGESTTGPPGFTALQLKGAAPFVLINDVDGDDEGTVADEPGEAQTIDLTTYFRGGTSPYTYSEPVRFNLPDTVADEADQADIDPALVDSGPMLKLSVGH